MEPMLAEIFEQARALVAEADRKQAEAEQRRREQEREARLIELAGRVETAFDFTSKEKLELDPRLDAQDGQALVEFVVRSVRAIFALRPQEARAWALSVLEDGRETQPLGVFQGGTKEELGSRRLAAARIVTAIGDWMQKRPAASPRSASGRSRWQDQPPAPVPESKEPTYGTFGKFLGVKI